MDSNPAKMLYDDVKAFGGDVNEDALTWIEKIVPALCRWLGGEDAQDVVLAEFVIQMIQRKLKDMALTWCRSWWLKHKPRGPVLIPVKKEPLKKKDLDDSDDPKIDDKPHQLMLSDFTEAFAAESCTRMVCHSHVPYATSWRVRT